MTPPGVRRHRRLLLSLLPALVLTGVVLPAGAARAVSPTVAYSVSSVSSGAATALGDGNVGSGSTGQEWTAGANDPNPWVQITFAVPRTIASIQAFGPSTAVDTGTTAPLSGALTFSDGSSVVVSGIAAGGGAATTIAFSARSVDWVRLNLKPANNRVPIALREFVAYQRGTTPPRWPTHTAPRYSLPIPTDSACTAQRPAIGSTTDGSPALVCPQPGSRIIGRRATAVVAVPPGSRVTAAAYLPSYDGTSGTVDTVATAAADAAGRAVLVFDATRLTQGPTAIRVTIDGRTSRALYIQFFNATGRNRPPLDTAPAGLTLQWWDRFNAPISLSRTGAGADYATLKPEATGGSEFGDAMFADPAAGLGTLGVIDNWYLRVRTQPMTSDPKGWGRTLASGLLSSARLGGSGFAAQRGYFEARMLGPTQEGTWPAFWLLNSESAAPRTKPASEIDILEQYGRFPNGSCHALHAWNSPGQSRSVCGERHVPNDWALTWHTYAAWVRDDRVDYYIDGRQITSIPGPILTDQPFFFMVNLAAGGGWPVDLNATGGIADLYVDWIRVYT